MAKETLSPQEKLPERDRQKDPNFIAFENGGILADLIQLQYPKNWRTPRRAQGPIVIDQKLLFFHVYDRAEGASFGPKWVIDAPILPDDYSPLLLTTDYTETDITRFREAFPDAQKYVGDDAGTIGSNLSEFENEIVQGVERAIALRQQKKTQKKK